MSVMQAIKEAEIEAQMAAAKIANADQRVADDAVFDGATEGGMTVGSNAEYVVIFSTETGVASRVRAERLKDKLLPNKLTGKVHFSLKPPEGITYTQDKKTGVPIAQTGLGLKCMLHRDHERRAEMDSIGLMGVFCPKSNIPTPFQLRLHMERKHKVEWATIQSQEEDLRRRREEDRQERMIAALAQRAEPAPVERRKTFLEKVEEGPVLPPEWKPKTPPPVYDFKDEEDKPAGDYPCQLCDRSFAKPGGLNLHMHRHKMKGEA